MFVVVLTCQRKRIPSPDDITKGIVTMCFFIRTFTCECFALTLKRCCFQTVPATDKTDTGFSATTQCFLIIVRDIVVYLGFTRLKEK